MILKFFWVLVEVEKLFWVHEAYLCCVETAFCSFWEIIFKVHYLWWKNGTANGGWNSPVGIILHLWSGLDFCSGLTRYRMCFLEANVVIAVTFPARKLGNGGRIPFADGIFKKWVFKSAHYDDEDTLSSLHTAQCKWEKCMQGDLLSKKNK